MLIAWSIGSGQEFDVTLRSRHSTLFLFLHRSIKSVPFIQGNRRRLKKKKNYSRSKKKKTINSNTNYRRKMKLVPIDMDYCLLQFDALKFLLGIHLHGRSLPNFYFFNVNPQIFQRNRKAHLSNSLETNFHNISNISLRGIRRRNFR